MDRYNIIYFELEKHIKDRVHNYISSHISSLTVGEVVGPWVGLTLGDAVGEVFMDRYDMIYFELEKHIKDRVHYYISSHISSLTVGDAVGPLVGLNVVGEAFINQVEYDGE